MTIGIPDARPQDGPKLEHQKSALEPMTVLSRKKTVPTMRVMRCMIRAWQPVRVVDLEGRTIRSSLARPGVTVAELLRRHPHHFVCEPSPAAPPLFRSAMLPLDMELEGGRVYLLLPLPRLLPHLSAGGTPSFCPCFHETSEARGHNRHFTKWIVRKYQGHLVSTLKLAKVVRSVVVRLSRRVLPERVRMRLSFHKLDSNFASKAHDAKPNSVQVQMCATRYRWQPGLECISEVDLLMTGLLHHDSELLMR